VLLRYYLLGCSPTVIQNAIAASPDAGRVLARSDTAMASGDGGIDAGLRAALLPDTPRVISAHRGPRIGSDLHAGLYQQAQMKIFGHAVDWQFVMVTILTAANVLATFPKF
jgi:hypothetical protein